MKNYRYSGDLVSIHDIDTLFYVFSKVEKQLPIAEIGIDLSNVRFVSPIGAISLLQVLNLLDQSFTINLNPSIKKGSVVSYLQRIDFFDFCPDQVLEGFKRAHDLERLSSRNRNDTSNVLLEIKRIMTKKDVDGVFEATLDILSSHGMKSRFTNRIATIVSEFSTNIIDHSKGLGFAAIQYYPSKNKVIIGIGDSGIGIVKSLRPYLQDILDEVKLTDLEIIKAAFEEGISSLNDQDRGWGLTDAREKSFLDTKLTSFYIRTHCGIYGVFNDEIIQYQRTVYYPGTYIYLDITF